ncbi:MAG: DUF2934 domain-containing protein [Terriglobales bacterium]
MARKTTGTTRTKKAAPAAESPTIQPNAVQATTVQAATQASKVSAAQEVRENVAMKPVNGNKSNVNGANLDEEIRRRAYELYLQRNGMAGDPNRDWFVAEREVRARHAVAGHSA